MDVVWLIVVSGIMVGKLVEFLPCSIVKCSQEKRMVGVNEQVCASCQYAFGLYLQERS